MAVIDLTDDINAQMRLSQNIGRGIGSLINGNRRRKQAEQAREQNRVNEMMTLNIMRGEGTAEEKLRRMEGIPQLAKTEMVKRIRQKQFEEEVFGKKGQSNNQLLAEFTKLQGIYENTQTSDPITGESTTVPGFETVAEGTQKRLKELTIQLFGDVEVPQTEAVAPEAVEEKPSLFEKVDRSLRKVTPAGDEGSIGEFIESKRQEREIGDVTSAQETTPEDVVKGSTIQELDRNTAIAILKEAEGDKKKAREIARKRGFKF
jgi:hypothetical protein